MPSNLCFPQSAHEPAEPFFYSYTRKHRPGLTGWAQINGRDELSIAEKARYDGEYVARLSFAFDVKCFFGTFGKVLRQEDVVEGAHDEKQEEALK